MPLDPSIPLSVRPFRGPDILAAQEAMSRMAQERRLAEQDAFEREKYQAARQQLAEQKAAQQAVGEAFQGATQADEQGQPVLNRGELMRQLAAKGQGHLWPTVSAELDKADQASLNTRKTRAEIARLEREEEDQKNAGLSRLGFAVEQAGNTPEAWSWLTQAAKQNRWATDEDLVPYEQAISQDPTKIASVTAALKSYGMKPTATGQAPTGRTREVQTVNEQGQPVIRIVPDVPGEYPARTPAQKAEEAGVVPIVRVNPRTGKVETLGEVPKGAHFVNEPAPAQSSGGGGGGSPVREAVTAMKEGTVPPQLPGRASKDYIAIMAEARRQGFNLAKAAEDWQATARYLSTLNGAQQVRLRQAVSFTRDSLGIIEDLAKQWDAGKFPLLNKANLALARNGAMGTSAASLATRLEAQINDLTSELGTVYKGGNSSTDESLKLAAENLKSNWSKQVMLDNLGQIRKNLEIREHSMQFGSPAGVTPGNPYTPSTGAPTGAVERVERGPDGKFRLVK